MRFEYKRYQHDGRKILEVMHKFGEPVISVSIMSRYGMDDRAIEVRSPADTKGFFL
jgi:hypothetical protein